VGYSAQTKMDSGTFDRSKDQMNTDSGEGYIMLTEKDIDTIVSEKMKAVMAEGIAKGIALAESQRLPPPSTTRLSRSCLVNLDKDFNASYKASYGDVQKVTQQVTRMNHLHVLQNRMFLRIPRMFLRTPRLVHVLLQNLPLARFSIERERHLKKFRRTCPSRRRRKKKSNKR
jgi:hypothetical protein